jgi:hypothetical protein
MFRLLTILTCCAALALAQDSSRTATQAPEKARYEILSVLPGPGSLRLDRFTGKISRLIPNRDQPGKWQDLSVPELPANPLNEPRFQVMVGSGNTLPLLLDTLTGRTWQLAYNATANTYVWGLVSEPTVP